MRSSLQRLLLKRILHHGLQQGGVCVITHVHRLAVARSELSTRFRRVVAEDIRWQGLQQAQAALRLPATRQSDEHHLRSRSYKYGPVPGVYPPEN